MRAETFDRPADLEAVPMVYAAARGTTVPAIAAQQPNPLAQPETLEPSTLGLVELILKDPDRVDALNREDNRQTELLPRFLSIALVGYTLFSIAMILLLNTADPAAYPRRLLPAPPAGWADGSALGLWLGYTLGIVAATCVCLPTFYFFALLAGVRMSMLQVAAQVLRGTASHAILLVGLLPIYVAFVLGLVVFQAETRTLEAGLYVGLLLPFLAGPEAMRTIYHGVMGMAETLPPERRCRRACFLRRLTLSWTTCHAIVAPVMIYRLWEFFAGRFV
jgi:hypothetical protein